MPGKSLFSGTGCPPGQIHQEKRPTFAYNLWLTVYHGVGKVLEKGARGTCGKGYKPENGYRIGWYLHRRSPERSVIRPGPAAQAGEVDVCPVGILNSPGWVVWVNQCITDSLGIGFFFWFFSLSRQRKELWNPSFVVHPRPAGSWCPGLFHTGLMAGGALR